MLERLFKNRKKPQQQNNTVQAARRKIIIQAVIAIHTVIIAIALVFGMSAAWYTNVLQTSGLQFEAEAWGFNGEILFSEDAVRARPGDHGIVGLTATNDSDDMINISVRVSKAQMVEEMQKRLFFYVDTALTRNEEILDRAYINGQDSYTYTILSHSQLTLTEEQSNDVSLKWQWVYDMEGYYFLGDVTKSQPNPETGETTVVARVEDYLRPVEYDLDNATFEEGLLATVGDQTVREFLKELSAKDGYEGDITPTDMPGYYKVDVDEETGHGIWVYLCNWAEIQQATTYDSQLGQAATEAENNETVPDRYIARLMVVGQMTRNEYATAYSADSLVELLNEGTMVQLQNDLELTETMVVNSGTNVVLDLNGHNICAPEGAAALELTNATRLILINGELQGSADTKNLVTVNGSMLTMSNVNLTGTMRYGVFVADDAGAADSCVSLSGCTINAETSAVSIRGNGEQSEGRSQLIIDNCQLTSNYIAVVGNGTSAYWGTDIQISNSDITGYYAALYQPQGDSLTRVWNSTLTGGTGIVMKGGDLRLDNCTVEGVFKADETQEPAVNRNGFSDTGDALYVDGSYDLPMHIVIENYCQMMVASENSQAIRVFAPEDNKSEVTVSVASGIYDDSVQAYVAPGYEYDPDMRQVIPVEQVPAEEEQSNAE